MAGHNGAQLTLFLPVPIRLCRRAALRWLVAAPGPLGLLACHLPPASPLRVGAHPWPGYELLYLARARQWLPADQVRLIEVPSASASLRGLATRSLEAACLTLDEVLLAAARGIELRVVAVLDVSMGADAVLGQPGIGSVAALVGKRIGVEPGATGAVMLDAMLNRHGLRPSDLQVEPIAFDEHEAAWRARRVDAIVTFEPVKSRLLRAGAQVLFSSAEVPGRIVDVLAVRADVLPTHGPALRRLLAGHFQARAAFRADPAGCAPLLADRLELAPAAVAAAYAELELPGVADNRVWLAGPRRLPESAARLREVMMAAGLLHEAVDVEPLATPDFLPADEP